MFCKVEHKKPTRELGNKMQMAQKKAGPDDITRRGPDKVQLCMWHRLSSSALLVSWQHITTNREILAPPLPPSSPAE